MQAVQANAAIFTKMQQDHTLALANLATSTQAGRTSVALLKKTISELSSQVATLIAKLATAQSDNARLNNRYIVRPQPSMYIVRPAIRPHLIIICSRTVMAIRGADTNSTLMGIARLIGSRQSSPTRPQLAASQEIATKN